MATLKYTLDKVAVDVVAAGGYTAGSGVLNLKDGSEFPETGDYWVRGDRLDEGIPTGDYNIFKVSSRTGNALAVTGGQEGTDDINLAEDDPVRWVMGTRALDQLRADVHQTGADASKSAEKAGNLYLPSDGIYLRRDTGAAFAPWGPIFPFSEPVDGDFAWINQGTATTSSTYGGVYLAAPAASSPNWRIRKKTAPGTPYTITVALRGMMAPAAVLFRQSSDGKLVSLALNVTPKVNIQKYTNATTWNSTYLADTDIGSLGPVTWLRIADNGTNRLCSVSINGIDWIQIHSVGRTDFLTADEVGWGIVGHATYVSGAHLLHWKEA